MKYLLLIHVNPAQLAAMSDAEREAIMAGHEEFQRVIGESGEFVSTYALADPTQSSVVRVRDGVPAVTDGPYLEAKEFLAGYYLVEVDSKERAVELAAMIPDAGFNAMEIRPVIHAAGPRA